jgi:hypothetical protein
MRASLEWHMEINVLRPLKRMFCFLPRWVAARDDSGVAKVARLLIAGGEGARAGEAGAAAEVPIAKLHFCLQVDDSVNVWSIYNITSSMVQHEHELHPEESANAWSRLAIRNRQE